VDNVYNTNMRILRTLLMLRILRILRTLLILRILRTLLILRILRILLEVAYGGKGGMEGIEIARNK